MARELSQEELLDFLCQAGGRVTNAALLGHFRRFLRGPGAAGQQQQQQRREQFKGFVNAVATVQQQGAGGPKYVVLRRRYRDFLGQASGAPGGRLREPLQPQQQRPAPAAAEPGRQGAEPPPAPPPWAAACPAPRCGPGQPEGPRAPARLRPRGEEEEEEESRAAPPPASSRPRPAPAPHGWGRPPPVFRSIRCQLALQGLEDFIEEGGGSGGGGGRDSPQEAGDRGAWGASKGPRAPGVPASRCPQLSNGWPSQGRAKGQVLAGASGAGPGPRDQGPRRGRRSFWGESVPGTSRTSSSFSSSEDELTAEDQGRRGRRPRRPRKLAILAPPDVDAPITFQHLGWRRSQGSVTCAPAEEALPAPHRPPAPRLPSVPLEPREHNWVVMVAAGSWVQVRALFLEDPQLALQRDFISGYTALHWIAKHGASQVLQDFIGGAEKAGIHLDGNVKSSCGYTPLHLAAIHGHQRIMTLLVQKLKSKVHLRDSSGKRPWQYLSSSTSGEVWQLLQAPKGKTIFSTQPLARHASHLSKAKSQEVARTISRKASLAACLKPQHMKWKMATKYPALREPEEYSD